MEKGLSIGKWLLLAAVSVLLLASCSKDDKSVNEDPQAVRFVGGIDDQAAAASLMSRAAGTAWNKDDAIGIFMVNHGTTTVAGDAGNKEFTTPAGDGIFSAGPGDEIYYPQDGRKVDFIAYYPHKASGELTGTIPVSTADQSRQTEFDMMWTKANGTGGNGYDKTSARTVPLEFRHCLAKLTMNCKAAANTEITSFDGMTVTIKGMNTAAVFVVNNGSVSQPSMPGDIIARKAATATGYLASYDAIIVPDSYTAADAVAVVFTTASGDSYVWNVGAMTFAPGNDYIFTVTLTRTGVQVEGTIIPWTTVTIPDPVEAEPAYTLTYNINGGTGTLPGSYTGTSGAVVQLASGSGMTPPVGKTFFGWNTLAGGGGDFYKAGTDFTVETDLELYAMWSGDGGAGNPIMVSDAPGLQAIGTSLDKEFILVDDIGVPAQDIATGAPGWIPVGTFEHPFTGKLDGNAHTVTIGGLGTVPLSNGNNYYAGLFGYMGPNSEVRNIRVAGTISLSTSSSGSIENRLGGIAGSIDGGLIENCAVTADLTAVMSGNGIGRNYVGGIAGEAGYNIATTIRNCYTTGSIGATGNGDINSACGIAGVAFDVVLQNCVALNGSLSATGAQNNFCYRIMRRSSNSSSIYANNYGSRAMTGVTTTNFPEEHGIDCDAQPTEAWWTTAANWSTENGAKPWDFTDIWEMGADGYPALRVE